MDNEFDIDGATVHALVDPTLAGARAFAENFKPRIAPKTISLHAIGNDLANLGRHIDFIMHDVVQIILILQARFPTTKIFISPALPRFYKGAPEDKYRQRFFRCNSRLNGICSSRKLNHTGNVHVVDIDERIRFREAELWDHDEYPAKAIHLNSNGLLLLKNSFDHIVSSFR